MAYETPEALQKTIGQMTEMIKPNGYICTAFARDANIHEPQALLQQSLLEKALKEKGFVE